MNEKKPFWDENRRKYARILAWALVVLAVLGADMLGLRLPIPDTPVYSDSALEADTLFTSLATTNNTTVGGILAVTGASNLTGNVTTAGLLDVNGVADALVLDADGDTTLSAPTDDQINIEIAGADDFLFSANSFEAQAGSVIDVNGVADGLRLDLDSDTSFSADTDDTINIEVAGADDFVITANTLTASAGSSIVLASGALPLGYATTGSQLVYGTDSITGTATAAHGLTTVTFAVCTLGEDPESGAGDSAMCTVSISSNVVTLDIWQDDFVTAATEVDTVIHWLVVGVP